MTPATKVILNYKGSPQYAEWFDKVVATANLPATLVVELALRSYAKEIGFDKPQPWR